LLSISRDITEEWQAALDQKIALERQQFLTAELTHRVKNTLATVLALAIQTFRGDAHKEPCDAFIGRIKTMGEAYNVLTDASWTSTSFKAVVEGALAPYRTGTGRFTISGPDCEIKPAQALTLALAVNELATNAMKYGALSVPAGRIEIVWTIMADEKLRFEWRESGGPPVAPPVRTGFGSRLIKTLLAGDFGGTVDLRYAPAGVTCVLEAPMGQTAA
jgi:two-component sensor histidine kinase